MLRWTLFQGGGLIKGRGRICRFIILRCSFINPIIESVKKILESKFISRFSFFQDTIQGFRVFLFQACDLK